MMQHLTNDPSFWVAFWAFLGMLFTALATLLGLLIAWAKAKTAEIEARDAKAGLVVTAKSLDRVEQAAGTVAAQVSTHAAQIAALQTQQGQGPAGAPAPAAASDAAVAHQAAQTAAQMVALQAQQTAERLAAAAASGQQSTASPSLEPPAFSVTTVSYPAAAPQQTAAPPHEQESAQAGAEPRAP